ncbi:MAG: hypothetical protein ISR69_13180 [Gammaproteobacteria bacterium]|nr:hypothetical protein [Gammaproteobacteria bacterium]
MKVILSLIIFVFSTVSVAELRDPMEPPLLAKIKLKKLSVQKNKAKVEPKKERVEKKSYKKLSLQSTLISRGRKVATINQKVLSLGDSIESARLVRIRSNSVRLIRNEQVIDLIVSNKDQSKIKITRSTKSK